MNAVSIAGISHQNIYSDKEHHGTNGSGLINKPAGRVQSDAAKMGDSIRKSPIIRSTRPSWTMRKCGAQSRLEEDQAKEIRLLTVAKRAELGNNLEGAGDGSPLSNIWDNNAKRTEPLKSAHIPSYLQTTLSYRMKCVNKPKNDNGEGVRIPFVVGNYANKSHNVGSKIQETLSLIKGAPRRLLDKTKKEKEELGDLMRCMTATAQNSATTRSQGDITRNEVIISKRRRSAASTGATTTSEYKNYQFRTVLMNLHDEFAKMNSKYEELQNSLKAKYNVEVAHQVLNLEEELNAKEVEINAFVNLYNEVSQLKKRLINRTVEVKNERHSATQLQSEGCGGVFQDRTISTSKNAYRKKLDQFSDHVKNKVH